MTICRLYYCLIAVVTIGTFAPGRLLAQTTTPDSATVTNKFYSPSGKWVQNSNTNCVVWSSWPREGESVTWSGGVVDGKAHGIGVLQWFTNGIPTTLYQGEMKAGLADGHGIAKGAGEEYEGEWKQGSLVSTNGTINYANGNWYRGAIQNGFKTGHGEELMTGGVRYIGEFKRDRFNGKGELLLPDGARITGEWRNSKLDGIGTYHTRGGDSFKVKQNGKAIERL